jgi:hypothetical protein
VPKTMMTEPRGAGWRGVDCVVLIQYGAGSGSGVVEGKQGATGPATLPAVLTTAETGWQPWAKWGWIMSEETIDGLVHRLGDKLAIPR